MLKAMPTIMQSKRLLLISLIVIIFALAGFLRIDFLTSVNHKVSHDTVHYDAMVRQLLEKGVYGYKSTEPNANVTPGFPLFMASVYKIVDYKNNDPYPYIRYIQVMMSLVTLGMLYVIAKKLGGRKVAVTAIALGAVYPPFVWSNAAILTEVLATLFLMIYIYVQLVAFEKGTLTSALLSGLAMGFVVLTRSEFLILIFALYAFYFFWKKNKIHILKMMIFTIIGIGIVLTPWVIRNALTFNQFIITSTQVNPFHAGTYPDKNYDDGLVDRKGKTQMQIAKERLKVGFTEHTWKFTKWYTYGKMKKTYSKMYFGSGHAPRYDVIPILPWNWPHMALIVFSLVSLAAIARKWRQPATVLAVILVTMSCVRLLFVPEYRYNYTVMPVIIIMDSMVGIAIIRWAIQRIQHKAASSTTTRSESHDQASQSLSRQSR